VDALVFAGGIGENSPAVRERSLHGLDALGLTADPARNEAACGTEAEISPEGAHPQVFVIPTDEELLIARDTFQIVSGLQTK
jgi:acetate kinase